MKKRVLSVLIILTLLYAIAKKAEAKTDLSYMVGSGFWQVEATAYCDCEQPTASGQLVRYGICATAKDLMYKTIAIYDKDMNLIGYFESLDTGGDSRIREGKVVDIWLPTYEECVEFGRQRVFIEVIDAEG